MSLAVVHSRAAVGVSAPPVTIEVHLANGFPAFNIVGLPETAVKESKHRVHSAISNSQFQFPVKRITVNLAPADLPKEGARFDLPIALGVLAASAQIPPDTLSQYEFAGELALTGELRPVKGMLPFAMQTAANGRCLIVPQANAIEASVVETVPVYAAQHLLEVCAHLNQQSSLTAYPPAQANRASSLLPDLVDVYGQFQARRALEIAAAGAHSLLLSGPPGAGKTMLASRLVSILPELNEGQAQEVAAIYSVSHLGFQAECWRVRPFRSPHHTSSSIALTGGGKPPHPGEISLAHHGVLFLDELPEFSRQALECLREPLESGYINISRAGYQVQFPAQFQLLAAMNPCPCGYLGATQKTCQCTPNQIQRYQHKLSGPLLDRIDMYVQVPTPPFLLNFALLERQVPESSICVRARVVQAQAVQWQRQGGLNAKLHHLDSPHYQLGIKDLKFLQQATERLGLSARAYGRILKLARTIADLAGESKIQCEHLQEALSYRLLNQVLDKRGF